MQLRDSRPPTTCCGEVWEVPHAREPAQPTERDEQLFQQFQKLSGHLQKRVLNLNSMNHQLTPVCEDPDPASEEDVEPGPHLKAATSQKPEAEGKAYGTNSSQGSASSENKDQYGGSSQDSVDDGKSPVKCPSSPTHAANYGTNATNSSQGSGAGVSPMRAAAAKYGTNATNSSQGSSDNKVDARISGYSGGTGGSGSGRTPPYSSDNSGHSWGIRWTPQLHRWALRDRCCTRSKPLSRRQRLFVLLTYGILQALAVALPVLVFTILITGLESRGAAQRVAGLSVLVAICHGLLARSPLHAAPGPPPRKAEDVAVELWEFADMACDYSFGDCLRLVEVASAEEMKALSMLTKLVHAEKKKHGAVRRNEKFSEARKQNFEPVKSTDRAGTPAFGPKLSLEKSRSTLSTGTFANSEAGVRHMPSSAAGHSVVHTHTNSSSASSARKVTFDRQITGSTLRKSSSSLSRFDGTKSEESGRSNYLRSRSGLSSVSEDTERRRPVLQKDFARSSSRISSGSRNDQGLRKSVTSHSEISITSFTDFNRRQSPFRVANGAAVNSTPLVLPDSSDKPARNDSTRAVANEFLPNFGGLNGTSGPLASLTEEDSDAARSNSTPDRAVTYSSEDRARSTAIAQPQSLSRTIFLEIDLPSTTSGASVCSVGSQKDRASDISGSKSAELKAMLPSGREMRSAVDCVSDAGMSYVSTCDAVLGEGNNAGEVVSAEVVNLGKGLEGQNRVRIEFKSQCLRTQNEWQRKLLNEQRLLLDAMSEELENAKLRLDSSDQLKLDQKELLRSFRKIVTREVPTHAPQAPGSMALPKFGVQIFIIEENPEMCAELEELCKMCEYPYQAFDDIGAAMYVIRQFQESTGGTSGTPKSNSSKVMSQAGEGSCQLVRRPSQATQECKLVPLVLVGASLLQRISSDLKDEELFVALTSQVEEFEEVGRQLFACGDNEVRELLRARGIAEYLMHPVSMSCLRGVATEVVQKHFGEEYLLVDTIGRGATGVVYRAKRLRDGDVFALKEISIRRLGVRARQEVMTETALLLELSWPTLVYLVDAFVSSNEHLQYLLMPILEGGSLGQLRTAAEQEDCKISAEHAMEWYAQTLHGVSYLHWCGVIHRDLKPANLLLDVDLRVLQIGDLGSAARLPGPGPHPDTRSGVHKDITTVPYSSPETLSQKVHYPGSDLWSVGVSFYEVFTLTLPHEAGELSAQLGSSTFNPRTLSSEGHDVVGPVRAALLESDVSDAGVIEAIATELGELMRADPFSRPTASCLIFRPGTQTRLWKVLRDTAAFEDEETEAKHMTDLAELRRDAEAGNKVDQDVTPRSQVSIHASVAVDAEDVEQDPTPTGFPQTAPQGDKLQIFGLHHI